MVKRRKAFNLDSRVKPENDRIVRYGAFMEEA